jgi:nucleotide-binding universal stress UspA family protein
MYRHILIPTDGSAAAAAAVDAGIALAGQFGAKLTFFTAMPRYGAAHAGEANLPSAEVHRRLTREAAERILAEPLRRARAARVEHGSLYLENDRPDQGIVDAAELEGCDLIVMASRRRGLLGALLYGSVTRAVLASSRIPALVYRRDANHRRLS